MSKRQQFTSQTADNNLAQDELSFLAKPTAKSRYNVLLVYPEKYEVGIGNLGHQLIWRTINQHPNYTCDRLYFTSDSPTLTSFDLGLKPEEFDVIAFPLYYELNLPNVLTFLKRANIEILTQKRNMTSAPLILSGGPLCDINPELVSIFSDISIVGDAEDCLPLFLQKFSDQGNYSELCRTLAEMPGFSNSQAVSCDRARILPTSNINLVSPIVSSHSVFQSTALIEIARGCPHHCTFCHIGNISKPFRPVPTDTVISWLQGITQSGLTNRVGLISAAVGGHPGIDTICEYAMNNDLKLTFSSLRAEDVTDKMLEALVKGGTKTITLAPEAGSLRLRKLLGKAALTNEVLFNVIERCLSLGMKNVKLYTMIGLPTETDHDILETVELIQSIKSFMMRFGDKNIPRYISVNASIFVPKPHSPLHNLSKCLAPSHMIKAHCRLLEKGLRKIGGVSYSSPSMIEAQVQCAIANSTGDDAMNLLLEALNSECSLRDALRKWSKHQRRDD